MRNIVKKCEQFKKEVRLEQFKSRVHDPLGVKVPHYVSEIVHEIIFSGANNVNLTLSALRKYQQLSLYIICYAFNNHS